MAGRPGPRSGGRARPRPPGASARGSLISAMNSGAAVRLSVSSNRKGWSALIVSGAYGAADRPTMPAVAAAASTPPSLTLSTALCTTRSM